MKFQSKVPLAQYLEIITETGNSVRIRSNQFIIICFRYFEYFVMTPTIDSSNTELLVEISLTNMITAPPNKIGIR